MKILNEDSEKVVIEMSKSDFYHLRSIFLYNKRLCDEELDSNEYQVAQKIIQLEDAKNQTE